MENSFSSSLVESGDDSTRSVTGDDSATSFFGIAGRTGDDLWSSKKVNIPNKI